MKTIQKRDNEPETISLRVTNRSSVYCFIERYDEMPIKDTDTPSFQIKYRISNIF